MVDSLIIHMSEFLIDALMEGMLFFNDGLGMDALLLPPIQYFLSVDVLHFIIISNDVISNNPCNPSSQGLKDK